MNRLQRAEGRGFALPITPDSPEFRVEWRERTHFSRLSALDHRRLRRKQTRQSTQVDRQHGQREYVADLVPAAQLDLPDRAAVLFAITKQGLDHLAHHLADGVH